MSQLFASGGQGIGASAASMVIYPCKSRREILTSCLFHDSFQDPDARKDWGQEENVAAEDEMVGWHHQLDGHEFEQTPGDSERQESLTRCSPQGRKESNMT